MTQSIPYESGPEIRCVGGPKDGVTIQLVRLSTYVGLPWIPPDDFHDVSLRIDGTKAPRYRYSDAEGCYVFAGYEDVELPPYYPEPGIPQTRKLFAPAIASAPG